MSDAPIEVIGEHISRLPQAIEDVWPIVDGSGTVIELVRTWDDEAYVCLDHGGEPVNEIAQTHHLMPRELFRSAVIPDDWNVRAVRRVSRGLSKIEGLAAAGSDVFGDRQEYEVLVKLNSGGGMLIDEIDTTPPYTHIVQLSGEFFLAQMRGKPDMATMREAPEVADSGEGGAAAVETPPQAAVEVEAPVERPVTAAQPAPEPLAPAVAVDQATLDSAGLDAGMIAGLIKAALAGEAAAAPLAPRAPSPPTLDARVTNDDEPLGDRQAAGALLDRRESVAGTRSPAKEEPAGGALLSAVEAPDGKQRFDEDAPTGTGKVALDSSREDMWGDDPVEAPGVEAPAVESRRSGAGSLLVSEKRADDDGEAAREASYAQATAFVTAASTSLLNVPGGALTLEQVRKSGRFAWDELMNLYLPHVGFVAAMPARGRAARGAKTEVTFAPRSEFDMRPIGWHHLADCDCESCRR